jgi:hypothetical protein
MLLTSAALIYFTRLQDLSVAAILLGSVLARSSDS